MITVILPVLNEATLLPAALTSLAADPEPHEIVVVDGGSTDESVRVAQGWGVRAIRSERCQRAAQMNRGAAAARGESLWFLHADTVAPVGCLGAIRSVFEQEAGAVGGGFARRFDHPSRVLALLSRAATWRGRLTGWYFGDQAIFVRRQAFEAVGGYADLDLFEDVDLCRRLKRSGRLVWAGCGVVTSGRRFTRGGVGRTILRDAWLTLRYRCGADPRRLAGNLPH